MVGISSTSSMCPNIDFTILVPQWGKPQIKIFCEIVIIYNIYFL